MFGTQNKGAAVSVEYKTVTREALRAELDRDARASLGVSGADFVARLRSGALNESSGVVARLAVLARLVT